MLRGCRRMWSLVYEVHYDTEINEQNAAAVADALVDSGMYLGQITRAPTAFCLRRVLLLTRKSGRKPMTSGGRPWI